MSSNLKVNTIQPSSGDTVSIAGIASITSSVSIASSCTATTFYGDGSNLTGVSGLSVGNQADNRLITCTGTTDTLNAESDLTFASNVLTLSGTLNVSGEVQIAENIVHSGDGNTAIGFPANDTIRCITAGSERLRINSSGDFGFNDASPTAHASGNNTVLSIKGKGSSYSGKIDFKDSSGNIDSYINSDNSILQFYCDPNSQNGNTFMGFYVHGANRVRINASGNMSLGGIDPVPTSSSYNTASFHIHQQTNNSGYGAQIHLTTANKGSGSAAGTQLSQYNGSLYINNQDDQFMYFYNNDNTGHRLAIRNDGTVCFGNQTSNGLYSSGSGSTWYDQKDSWQMAQSGDLGWSCWYMNKIGGSDNRMIQFNSSGNAIGYINRSGSNVVYQTSSDYRLKKDDVEISDGIERVKKLRPIKFKWKETNEESEGFFAHEAQEICPYAVSGYKDEVAKTDHGDRKKGDMIIQAVDYGEFTPLLSAAVKELITKVETLEQENIALRSRVTNLEGN